jgi:glycosyltransferase involved in cell wall biosynthesis
MVSKSLQEKDSQPLRLLSVIVPVYNEVFTLHQLLGRVLAVDLPKEVILVDDGSTDGSREILSAIERGTLTFPEPEGRKTVFRVIYHDVNQGKGASLRTGFAHASGDLAIVQDADLEYDPQDYFRLAEPILSGDADVVYGSRFLGTRRRALFFWHSVGNKILTLVSNIFSNLNLTDMETGYKMFKTEIIKSLPIQSNRFGFEPEITAKIAKLRCRVYEVPVSYNGRSYAEGKKIGWKDGVAAIFTILRFWLVDDLYDKTAGLRTLRIMEGAGDYNEWLFEQCRPYIGKRVLEMGSGVGNITKFLVDRERVIATDIIPFYLEELKRMFHGMPNVAVEKLDLTDGDTAERIRKQYRPNAVLSMNVLEHIENDRLALKNVNRLLEKGGRFALLVPAHQALYSDMDKNLGHFRRYDKRSLNVLLEEAGFRVESSRYLNFLGALGWFVNGQLLRRKLIPSRQVRAFDFLVKTLAIEKFISPPLGLSVLAVAHKEKDV